MDLVVDGSEYTSKDFAEAVREQIEILFLMLRRTPVVPMSSLYGARSVQRLMHVVFEARDRWARVIPMGMLNRWLEEVLNEQGPPNAQ